GAYFAVRSVDYVLLIALLPFCALAIPAALSVTAALARHQGPAKVLAVGPVAIGVWGLTFVSVPLFRERYSTLVKGCPYPERCAAAPYSFYLHECRGHGRCTPTAVLVELRRKIHEQPGLYKLGHPRADYWYDTSGALRDALAMMAEFAPGDTPVTVLLGHIY